MCIAPIAPVYLCTDPTLCPTQTRDLAPVVAFLAAAFTFSYCWKQRKRRAEQALAQQTQRGGGATYRSQYSSAGGPRLFAPQAPPPTIASTPHTFMIPPRALLRCVKPPSSLPPSLTDPLTLCLVAFRPVAAVSAPGHIRPEGNGVGWF